MNLHELKTRPFVCRYELLEHYASLGLNESDLIILMKILYAYETSNELPSIDVLQKGTTMQASEITMIIQKLIQLGLLEMNVAKNNDGRLSEYINLDGFYEQLNQVFENINSNMQNIDKKQAFKALFQKIENGFGRTLSALEFETLNKWLDVNEYDLTIIHAAVDEALSHNKTSLKYVDRILLNWEKNNVRTVDDAKPIRAKFNKQQSVVKKIENFPKFDWLKGENPFDK
ncbi:DnaD domain protein [Staphylococcus muscae]|uniref:Chromosome replication protein DnaD n=1 Tax=Staphylococcus muscae TaxID=1294 RepID=A0A240C6F0_9STAP|nr:DnaD domain-containing protein [Staphylococcus muscae]AVQ33160.1 DnaD domain protein [Staphylococcus muscae]PNZ05656.1 DnaD domain protein [Staphylococcus muscae]GGA95585.1 chromosome replication protein DnaD [Staphylococcus muscae]SNW02668.1 DNA replication protein DnaD [Staphylococcus muscae]